MLNTLKRLRALYRQMQQESEFPNQRLPTVIQFPINDICNSRCQMCNIWQQKKDRELSAAEVRRILSDSVFAEVTDVGVNGGEPTLRKDIGEIAQALIDTLPRLQALHLITNAVVYDQVTMAIDKVGRKCRERDIRLDVMVSLDGIGDVHDLVRGRQGNFDSAVRVVQYLQQTDVVTSHRIGCTVIKDNVYDVENVLDWCIHNQVYARFRVGIPHQRLYSSDFPGPAALDDDERFHLLNFLDDLRLNYEQQPGRRAFYLSLRNQLAYGLPRSAGCAWKSHGVTLGPRGEFAFCAVESPNLGNALEESAGSMYWNNRQVLSSIQRDKCAGCLHDYEGAMVPGPVGPRFRRELKSMAAAKLASAARSVVPEPVRRPLAAVVRGLRGPAKPSRAAAVAVDVRKACRLEVRCHELPPKILICGWYGTETLGDKAILSGLIHSLRQTGSPAIDLASLEPYVSAQMIRQMPELDIRQNLSLAEARRNLENGAYRGVVMGGGPLMSAIAEVAKIRDLFLVARQKNAAAIVAGCGIGPLGVPDNDVAITQILRLATDIVLRDQRSAELAVSLARLPEEPPHCLDPAFHWLQRQESDWSRVTKQDQILLALRDWPIREYAADLNVQTAEEIRSRFETQLIELVDELKLRSPETRIVPFCMHKYAVGGNDRRFYRRLLVDFPDVLASLDHRHRAPGEDVLRFVESRAVLAMRFHSVVFSLGAHVPFEAIDYTRGGKIRGLLEDLGLCRHLHEIDSFQGRQVAENLLSLHSDQARTALPAERQADCGDRLRQVFSALATS